MEKGFVQRRMCLDGHHVLPSHKFCSTCGKLVTVVAVPGCIRCNYVWTGGDKFCPYCGRKRDS